MRLNESIERRLLALIRDKTLLKIIGNIVKGEIECGVFEIDE